MDSEVLELYKLSLALRVSAIRDLSFIGFLFFPIRSLKILFVSLKGIIKTFWKIFVYGLD
jgi:hypothetical protein